MISSLVGDEGCLGDVPTAEFEGWHGRRVVFVKGPSLEPFSVELEGYISATLRDGDVVAEAFAVAAFDFIGKGWVVPHRNISKGRAVMHGKEGVGNSRMAREMGSSPGRREVARSQSSRR
eukprot:3333268-Prymnesium_polylepis.1